MFWIRIKLAIKNYMKLQYLKLSQLLFITLLLLTACKENPVSNNKTTYQENLEKEVHRLINIHRTSIGLEELEWNETIANECQIHSNNLAGIRAINHDGFISSIPQRKSRMHTAIIKFDTLADPIGSSP